MTPSEKMSARASAFFASTRCSGAMYDSVPMDTWVLVRAKRELAASPRNEASPKSVTLAMLPACLSKRMFSGFRSRWITPRVCA